MRLTTADAERFWSRVDKTGECWNWIAGANGEGRGVITIEGRPIYAPRVALALDGRPLPPGMLALHTCDNARCVRPSHLWHGTNADNMRDMARKGRSTRGIPKSPEHRAKIAERVHAYWMAHPDLNVRSLSPTCRHGHAYGSSPARDKNGNRICPTCHTHKLERQRARYVHASSRRTR